ncbi:MAG: energy-coupled thiamine transporter ThiT [Clostridia bacterium]|nr:energy-coupled thiamine transporter ThiT [Clostridia bacterium]
MRFFYCLLGVFDIELPSVIALFALLALIVILFVIASKRKTANLDSRAIVYAAISASLSFVLSYVKLDFAYGGSITFASCLPLLLYAYAFGPVRGLLAGLVYGLLQFIQAPYAYHAIQVILDYPLPFMGIFLGGIFRKMDSGEGFKGLYLALACYIFWRLVCHTGSGIYFYNQGWIAQLPFFDSVEASQNLGAFIYSVCYNAFYLIPDGIVAAVALAVLHKSNWLKRILLVMSEK